MSNFTTNVFPKVDNLIRSKDDGEIATSDALQGNDVIGLYFSASWCGPCRRFTPQLVEAYETLKKEGKGFEIVFISSDSDLDEFKEYFRKMPWFALPYEDYRELQEELSEKYECQGIPHLVLLDGKTGKIISKDGRSCISEHGPSVFPWTEDAIAASKEAKNAKICEVFKSWSLFPTEISESLLASPAEAVVVLIGTAEGPAQHVAPRLQTAYKALGSSKLKVVVIPTKQGKEEDALHASFPTEWHVIKDASSLLSTIATASGTTIDESDSLMVFNGQGDVMYNSDASRLVYQLKESLFPWKAGAMESFKKANFNQPGLKFLSDARLVSKTASGGVALVEGSRSASEILMNNDLVGLYFSAHWCGPCRGFTPVFAEVYNQLKADGKKVEVVFLSSDKDQQAFESYFTSDMPWLAVDYAQRELKELISMSLEVRGIPTLVWVNPQTGEMMMNGRETVAAGANYFPWTKELMENGKREIKERETKKAEEAKKQAALVEQTFRDNHTVVLTNHKGRGEIKQDYSVKFDNFNTFKAEVQLSSGRWYYEIEVVKIESVCQFGWATAGFDATEEPRGQGVGDDTVSWGFDGIRRNLWGDNQSGQSPDDNSYGPEWNNGDVLGLAVDVDQKSLSFFVNGIPLGIAFSDISLPAGWIAPAISAQGGSYKINFGERPFKFTPPESYAAVHSAI